MVESIKAVLMRRDGMSDKDANNLISECQEEFNIRMETGEDAYDICQEYFGLEPDYLDELM